MQTLTIGAPSHVKPNATIRALHLQKHGDKPDTYVNICGNGNSYRSKNIGKPASDDVFFNAVLNSTYRVCPTCLKLAVARKLLLVVVPFKING